MTLTGLLLMSLWVSSGALQETCRAPDGFTIRSGILFVERSKLRETGDLGRLVEETLGEGVGGETNLIISTDTSLWTKIKKLPLAPVEKDYPVQLPLSIEGPMAYVYQIGGNVLYQFGSEGARAHWRVLKGSNVLNPVLSGRRVEFARMTFGSNRFGRVSCESMSRRIALIVPGLSTLSDAEIIQILQYYDDLLPRPTYFSVRLFECIQQAKKFWREDLFPMMESSEGHQISTCQGARSVAYARYPSLKREMHIYSGGKPDRGWIPVDF